MLEWAEMGSKGKLESTFGYNDWPTFPEEDLSTQPESRYLDELQVIPGILISSPEEGFLP